MKFGIVGTNFVSDFFMDGAKLVDACEVVGVADVSQEIAKRFADKYDIPNAYGSYQEMAEAGLIDAVYIAVPNGLHKEISMYFLDRKIPTFCEKPLASNKDEVAEMYACATKNNTYLQEGLIPLYNPNLKKVKESISQIGKIHQVTFTFAKYSSRYDAYLRGENPSTFRSDLANGAIMDLGVYVIADCIALFGKPKEIISRAEVLDTGADVAGASIFVYDDFIATLSYSKASDTKNLCEICGEQGMITIDQPSQPQEVILYDRIKKESKIISEKPSENFYYEIKEMIEQVNKGEISSVSVPHTLSKEIHEVLSECRKEAKIVFPCDK
ncbi:putative dehydrogenase [Breznakia sp. PF5-3]|uniref:Gfo/Idh/MocA family protein n=1 Tax=unclassified Breznakia TaxID=2623764 RepID=UPI0024061B33|nr:MULTISPECIES: Gfo/Idh/MocA family oxidoreductase [unclassified Breznakia]MDF9825062.1 putative dehydrogenase [Breznakia sp. PM6-1]MDF9835909.1 putative dehydrogenase [Breznakia sp. PF5-3]MDF9837370.1 putative dehydrogenase [Breznakia sp. PFB2-8]MDF9859305.1 putative dehydrogenase [Breznakia sp. PH5-24]